MMVVTAKGVYYMYEEIDIEQLHKRLYYFSQEVVDLIVYEATEYNDALIEWIMNATDEEIADWCEEMVEDGRLSE